MKDARLPVPVAPHRPLVPFDRARRRARLVPDSPDQRGLLPTPNVARSVVPLPGALLLLVLALVMEIVLIAGWLRPLALWQHAVNPPDGAPMVTFLGRTRAGALQFAAPAAMLALLYAAAVWTASHVCGRAALVVAMAASILFAATLVPVYPGGTQDIVHNIADARLAWRHGENPTLVPPSAHPEDPFYRHLFGYADLPSAYGPLWYALVGVPAALAGDGLVANLAAQKSMMALFLVATVLIAWSTARHVGANPVVAVVAVGWCPLVLWEAAGSGHNDVIMVFFAAAALAAAARRWWLLVFPLLALSALVKFTTLLLGPIVLVWMLYREGVPRRAVVASLGAAAVIVVGAYVPFWAGTDTFAFLERPGMTFMLSPATLLHGALAGRLGDLTATRVAQSATGAAFIGVYVMALTRVRAGVTSLGDAGFDAVFGYLVFASWWFWPWYLTWLVPLVALHPTGRRLWMFVASTSAALLSYCYWWSDPPARSYLWFLWYTLLTLSTFAIPLLIWIGVPLVSSRPRGPLPPTV